MDHVGGVFFVADEYDGYTTQRGDGDFFSKCREAKCCTVIATQTYESFVAKLENEHVAAQLIANERRSRRAWPRPQYEMPRTS